jgi:hypothetical protein
MKTPAKATHLERPTEAVTVAEDLRDAVEIAGQLVQAIAALPTRQRDRLAAANFNDLFAERGFKPP